MVIYVGGNNEVKIVRFILKILIITFIFSQNTQALISGSNQSIFKLCNNYSRQAIEQNNSQLNIGCGYTGKIWLGTQKYHFQWCVNSPPEKMKERYQLRVKLLKNCMKAGFTIPKELKFVAQSNLNHLLVNAVDNGSVIELQKLISYGAAYTALQHQLMSIAISEKKYAVILFLNSLGVELSSPGNSPLSSYISSKDPSGKNLIMIRWLLDKGVNPNDTDSSGETPLEEAISYQNEVIVNLLLERGANPNMDINGGDCETTMPLDVANKLESKQIINSLKALGAKTKRHCSGYFSLDIET